MVMRPFRAVVIDNKVRLDFDCCSCEHLVYHSYDRICEKQNKVLPPYNPNALEEGCSILTKEWKEDD